MNFKMKPFHCAECGSELLIDGVSEVEGNFRIVTPKHVLCLNSEKDIKPGFRGMGRQDLIKEILNLRNENAELRQSKSKKFWDWLALRAGG